MFSRRTPILGAVFVLALALTVPALPSSALPLSAEVTADRIALERVAAEYEEAEALAAEVEARALAASAELDRLIAEEQRYQGHLQTRVSVMYRTEDTSPLTLLLTADSIQELAERLDLIERMARLDAENMVELKAARAEARRSAEELLTLQAEHARVLEDLTARVTAARQELAASQSALADYEARVAAAAAARRAAAKKAAAAPSQQLTGSGEWRLAVASHYGLNFSGRGASGESIGPYSMMVAHKTLPFGTLVEFEYNGRRAVARVADRGPYTPGREFDLGPGVARVLQFNGVRQVSYRVVSQ
jgi:rare lipoprotein A